MRSGFSLVELMVVVAIVGVLAAIAIPNFLEASWRAKRAEIPGNVSAIRDAEVAYNASYDSYLSLNQAPRAMSALDSQLVMWPGTADPLWVSLGWEPDGAVRGSYESTDLGNTFKVQGHSDVDGDGIWAHFEGTPDHRVRMLSVPSVF